MTTPTTYLHLYQLDLEACDRGSRRRALLQHLDAAGIDHADAMSPSALGQLLQATDPATEERCGHLLAAAAIDRALLSLAVVACTPAVKAAIGRAVGFAASTALREAVELELFERLSEVASLPAAGRRGALVRGAVRAGRAAARRPRGDVIVLRLEQEFDRAELRPEDFSLSNLDVAVAAALLETLTTEEHQLIATTRISRVPLRDVAASHHLPYATVQRRRARAEARLRHRVTELTGIGR